MIKVMILAAGEGTRLRPLTLTRPKPMLPVGGLPVLEWIVAWLRFYDVRELAINLHHCPDAVTEHFGDGAAFDVKIRYSPEPTIMGSAGGLKLLEEFFSGTFVVAYGDVLTDMDLSRLLAFHQESSTEPHMTLSLYRAPNPTECGIVALDAQGRVLRFVEKPAPDAVFSDLTNGGILVMDGPLLAHVPEERFYDLSADLIPDLLARGVPIYGQLLEPDAYLIDMGTPDKYEQAQREWPTERARDFSEKRD
jgi:mannose-1-phosphate guanylyltransferase